MKTLFYRLSKTTKLILSVPSTHILSSPIRKINAVNPMKTKNIFSQRILMLLCLMMVSMWGWGQTVISTGSTVQASTITAGTAVIINAGGTLNMDVSRSFITITTANDGTSTISGSGTLTVSAANGVGIAPGNTLSLNTICNSTILRTTSDGTCTIAGSGTLNASGNVVINKAKGNNTGLIVISSGVTVNAAQVENGTGNNGTWNITINGTLGISGTTFNLGTLTTVTASIGSTINYNGTVAQTVFGTTYFNLTISGSSTKTLSVATTISATLAINGGATLANGGFAIGSPTAITLECGAAGSTISGTGILTLGGNVTVNKIDGTGVGATISCPVALTAATTRTFTVEDETTSANDLTISGIVSTTGGLTKSGVGTLLLSGTNTYSGTTTISEGMISAGTIVVSGSASNLGNAASAVVLGGSSTSGALSYTGSAATFARGFTVNAGGGSIINTTANLLTIGTAGVTTTGAVTLSNASTGVTFISSAISSTGSLIINNTGTGVTTLSGTNTYSGGTTLSAGALTIGNTGALGSTSGAFTISGTGTATVSSNVTVGSLTIGGLGTAPGTWGSSTSNATNKNSAFVSTGLVTVSIDTRTTPTVSPMVGAYTYNGAAQGPNAATNTGTGTSYTFSYAGTGGATYAASATRPTNVGSYTVTATVTANGNYNSASSIATAFTITKATPTATLVLSNSPTTYSGSAQSATVGISTSSVLGTVTTILTGGLATQTNVATYAVTASFVPTDSANYNTLTDLSAGNFVISPAALTITADNKLKCFGDAYVLGTAAFTSIGLVSLQTIGSLTLASTGADSAAAVDTYSIVPSAATGGTFSASNYSITYSNGVLTVNPTNTVGAASSTPTLCLNTALAEITHATTGAAGIGAATGLPAGVVATFASNTLTISGTPTASAIFNYSIPLTGGCGSVNATGTITVSPASAGGTVAGSATVCSGTNSTALTLSGHTGTITRWESSLDNFTTAGTSIANTTTTLTATNLTATTYYRAVVISGACASAYSTVVTVTVNSCINKWKGSISNDWNNAGNWTQNLVPAVDANLVFDDAPMNHCYLDQNRSVTNITNSQGVYGIVLNGKKLTLKGNLLSSGGATIDASASNSTMQFSGSAVQSISTGVFKNDAVYNLDINNLNNVILSGNLRLLNNFTATTGLLDAFTNSPTVTYAGNTVQTIEGNQFLGGKIVNLTIDNGIGVHLNTNFTITNTLVINIGKKLSVSSLYQLTALGTISNNGGTSGLILKSNAMGTASLLNNTNNVPATVERYISGPTEGWHFLSAPVYNQAISGSWLPAGSYGTGNTATGTGFDLYLWDEPSFSFKYKLDTTSIGWNSVHSGTNFSAGRGYLYSVQESKPTKEFIGNLNNGSVNYPISFTETLDPKLLDLKGFNLVGNPYPSSADWQAASGWDRSKLEVSGGGSDMWVWNPTANNYGVFNSASGIGTNSISRYLAPMQGYFVKAASSGNLVFDNSVRVHTGAGNWFKNTGIKNQVIRITVESEDGNGADEALLQFGYADSNQGTSKLFSQVSSAPSLYLNLKDKNYTVRYLTNTAENNAVPMEFKAGKEGVYKLVFNFDSKELDFMLLEDRLLKTSTSLKPVSSYLFKSSKEDNVSRFVLHFAAPEITTKNVLNGLVYLDGSQIAVDLKGINGQTEIKVFDNTGKLILQKYLEGNGLTKLDLNLATQILLVRLTNVKGASSTKVLFSPLKQ
jgi:autotransporter-associated beta strand protein